jgi:hypothetical protein
VHQNTDNWHMHIAINKVHPLTFRNMEPFRDHFRLQETCAELEVKHGLMRDNDIPEPDRGGEGAGRGGRLRGLSGLPFLLQWVRENAGHALSWLLETAAKAGRRCTGWRALITSR